MLHTSSYADFFVQVSRVLFLVRDDPTHVHPQDDLQADGNALAVPRMHTTYRELYNLSASFSFGCYL